MMLPCRFLSFNTVLLLLISVFCIAAPVVAGPDANGIIYVKKNVSGSGASWADALPEVADALQMAKALNAISPGTVKQIWVAKGVYTPAYNSADDPTSDIRDNAFVMEKDVRLYGGFSGDGTEDEITDRDLSDPANETILSGDLEGNDGPDFENNSANAYHVVISSGAGQATIDGFTIEGGNADGENNIVVNGQNVPRFWAGGIFINGYASLILDNLVIRNNSAGSTGGGIALYMYASARLSNVAITGNKAGGGGGGITSITNTTLEATNVTITGNHVGNATGDGGGIYLNSALSTKLRSMVISGNSVSRHGGGIYTNSSYMELTDVLVTGNSSSEGGGVYFAATYGGRLTNVTVSGNTASTNGNEWYNDRGTPVIRNSIIWGNGVAGQLSDTRYSLIQDQTEGGNPDYHLESNQNLPTGTDPLFTGAYRLSSLSQAVDAGSNDAYGPLTGAEDLAGKPRLSGTTIDIGAYEYHEGDLPVTLVSFKAARQENTVQLSWQTSEEINVSHFQVQRSTDGKNFESIGDVKAGSEAGKSQENYTFPDNLPLYTSTDILYYRLKMIDLDGTYAYSLISSVPFKNTGNPAYKDKLYPNPAKNGIVTLEIADRHTTPAVKVFDGLGRDLMVPVSIRNRKYYLETGDLLPGMYYVQIRAGQQQVMKLLIE